MLELELRALVAAADEQNDSALALLRRATAVEDGMAYAFGPPGNKSGHWVLLKNMQATTVARDLPPTLPYGISIQDREMFMRQLTTGGDQDLTTEKSTSSETSSIPIDAITLGEQTILGVLNTLYVPPVVTNIVQQTKSPSAPVESPTIARGADGGVLPAATATSPATTPIPAPGANALPVFK